MSESRRAVYAAIASNAVIAVMKFVAAAFSGSSAMFSEGLHSIVDTGDGLLILLGLWLSKRPATRSHPYGHGAQVYFWSLVVAMSIFGAGGVVSIYEGIHHLDAPALPSHPALGLGVLGAAFVFEGISWLISIRAFRHARGKSRAWDAIVEGKDPTSFVVVLEDSAALLGIIAAATGITLAIALHDPLYDAIGSIVVGTLLVTVGIILGRETWSLLLGESASPQLVESVRSIARSHPEVRDVRPPRSMHIGPDHIHFDLELDLEPGADAVETSRRIEDAIRAKHPTVGRVSVRFPRE